MQLNSPNTGFRFRLLLPPALLLLLLILGLSVTGSSWVRDISRRLAQAHAEAKLLELASSPQLQEALKNPSDKTLMPQLVQAIDTDSTLLFAMLKLRDQTFIGTHSGHESDQLRELLYERQRLGGGQNEAAQSLGNFEFVVARRMLPTGKAGEESPELTVAANLARHGAEYRTVLWSSVGLLSLILVIYVLIGMYVISTQGQKMEQLMDAAHRIESGELKVRMGALMPDDLVAVGRAFDTAAERLTQAVSHLTNTARTVERTNEDGQPFKVELEFEPQSNEPMLIACLWSRTPAAQGELLSFAAISDEPPPEIVAAGHDRCPIPLRAEHIDRWLTPDPTDLMAQYAILDDRAPTVFEHRIAAAA